MRFNAKDFYATVLVAAIIVVYIAYLQDSSGWIISSGATTAVVAVLGIGACAMGRVGDLYARDRSLSMAAVATWASMLGIITESDCCDRVQSQVKPGRKALGNSRSR